MANFSDDETYAIDKILDQRKRKGMVEYLVQWKGESSEGDKKAGKNTWEPAKTIAADCALAVENFLKSKTKKRSVSKSRKSSRSRSRSVSRGRKAVQKSSPTRRSTRSSSRGRVTKIPVSEKKATKQVAITEYTDKSEDKNNSSTTTVVSSVTTTTSIIEQSEKIPEKKETEEVQSTGRVLRSSTMAAREKLEVQRVHNEQRPTHQDDDKPRSAIWKVADYIVIVLFALSVIAALFLFLEKFIDLEKFKSQAFPDFSVLTTRLTDSVSSVFELLKSGVEKILDLFLNVFDLIGSGAGKGGNGSTKK